MITLRFTLGDSKPFDLSFDVTASISTAKEFLSYRFKTIKDNITLSLGHKYFSDGLLLSALKLKPKDVIQVNVSSSRPFLFLQPGKQPFELPFRENATISDAKRAISPRLKIIPERISLVYENKDLPDTLRLIDLNIPQNRHINIDVSDDQIPTRKYIFIMQGDAKEIPFGESTTISEVKDNLLQIVGRGTKSVDLIYDGRPLNDDKVTLEQLKIPKEDFIIAQIKNIECKEIRDLMSQELPVVSPRPDTQEPSEDEDEAADDNNNGGGKKMSKDMMLSNMASQLLHDSFAFQPPERKSDPPPDPTS